ENKTYGVRFLKSYGFAEEKELLLTIGGSGFLEISVNKGNASELLGAKVGEEIFIDLG
ncbi:MAG: SAM-dependent chlorinase/fluorinase, partial [Thermoplasmata archaeon]|nr:SAM-dependent chlorinase/fluorinase [Thermoplasmata archaeon]